MCRSWSHTNDKNYTYKMFLLDTQNSELTLNLVVDGPVDPSTAVKTFVKF